MECVSKHTCLPENAEVLEPETRNLANFSGSEDCQKWLDVTHGIKTIRITEQAMKCRSMGRKDSGRPKRMSTTPYSFQQ
jgi:hypothetical protein